MAQQAGTESPPRAADSPAAITEAPIEPDVNATAAEDADSAIASSGAGSETTSLLSNIAKYRTENGRTYHRYKEGSYLLPNDDQENERLDLQHHLCLLTFGNKLFTAPTGGDTPLRRVLDGGCGTGIWALDLADEHSETEVVGVDLSPIQPAFVPPNLSFFVDDLEADWTYSHPFDLIFLRFLAGSISNWDKLIRQSFENLAPGGWIETTDAIYPVVSDDGTVNEDHALYKWSNLMREAVEKMDPGKSLDGPLQFKKKMTDVGFTNVKETWYKWPLNPWPADPRLKEMGLWSLENALSGLSGLSMALFTRVLGWKAEDVEVFLVEVRRDCRNKAIHSYLKLLVVTAQKPE